MPFAKFSSAALLCSLSLCAGAALAEDQASPSAPVGSWSFTVDHPPSSESKASLEPTIVSEVASQDAGWTVRTKRLEAMVPAKPFFSASGVASPSAAVSYFKVRINAKDALTGAPVGSEQLASLSMLEGDAPAIVSGGVQRAYLSSVETDDAGHVQLTPSVLESGFSVSIAQVPGAQRRFKVFSSVAKLVRMEELCAGESKACVQLPTTSSASAASDELAFEPGREVLVARLLVAGAEEDKDPAHVVYEVYVRRSSERVAAN